MLLEETTPAVVLLCVDKPAQLQLILECQWLNFPKAGAAG